MDKKLIQIDNLQYYHENAIQPTQESLITLAQNVLSLQNQIDELSASSSSTSATYNKSEIAYDPQYSFGGSTDAQLVQIIADADAGRVDLVKDLGWQVGDRRTINESSSSNRGVLCLWHRGGITLSNDKYCHFVVGLESTIIYSKMHGATTGGSWETSMARDYCNNTFRTSIIPSSIRNIFKQFRCKTYDYSQSKIITVTDYFSLPAEKEVTGITMLSNSAEGTQLIPFTFFSNPGNRVGGGTGGNYGDYYIDWWLRSSAGNASNAVVGGKAFGTRTTSAQVTETKAIRPFGCI